MSFTFKTLFGFFIRCPHGNVHLTSVSVPGGGGGGGGVTLIFSYIRRLGPFFGLKISNFNILFGFQRNKYFLGYEEYFWVLDIPDFFFLGGGER